MCRVRGVERRPWLRGAGLWLLVRQQMRTMSPAAASQRARTRIKQQASQMMMMRGLQIRTVAKMMMTTLTAMQATPRLGPAAGQLRAPQLQARRAEALAAS